MTVHEFLIAIKENKELYSEKEMEQLLIEWKNEYIKYLIRLADNHPDIDKYKDYLP